MVDIPPTLRVAIRDPCMQGVPLEVFLRCHVWLDTLEFRALAARRVRSAMRIRLITVRRTLSFLCDQGYLERGPAWRNGTSTFRIVRQVVPAGTT